MRPLAAFFLAGLFAALPAPGQEVLLDRGVRAAGLWCFPVASEPAAWVYLPAGIRLAPDAENRPSFSLVRYVANQPGEASASSIEAAGGGGVLHFLAEIHTPEEQVARAARELERRAGGEGARLRGPVLFHQGRYTLVSSILGGEEKGRLLAGGRAPPLEGNRIALSFDLEPRETTLLLASLEQATSDVSLVFDLAFRGLQPAYEAELVVDWDEVSRHRSLQAGATYRFLGAEIETLFDELRRQNAIRLESAGEAAASEALVERAYSRLLDVMFRPVEPEKAEGGGGGGLLDTLELLFDSRKGLARRLTGYGAHFGYRLKELRRQGRSVLSFRHSAAADRYHLLAFNLGDLHARHRGDPQLFRTVNLADPAFRQRVIHVLVDGALVDEIGGVVNHVGVTLRKRHGSGAETLDEMVVTGRTLAELGEELRLAYGWDGDPDRAAWLEYEVRTRWSFRGGGSFITPWTRQTSPVVHLYAPFERRRVELLGDPRALAQRGVRAVSVGIDYPFFDERRHHRATVRPGDGAVDASFELVLPRDRPEYQYTLTWILDDGRRLVSSGTTEGDVVVIDELPSGDPRPERRSGSPETAP